MEDSIIDDEYDEYENDDDDDDVKSVHECHLRADGDDKRRR
jgi:hypothetical protein